jgi:beta-phosphoglucomutase-like phosphatase (HAD superfamily)
MALEKAGLQPNEAMVVENAPLGVRSAKGAGIFTVAVNTGILSDDDLWQAGADVVLADMAALLTQFLI